MTIADVDSTIIAAVIAGIFAIIAAAIGPILTHYYEKIIRDKDKLLGQMKKKVDCANTVEWTEGILTCNDPGLLHRSVNPWVTEKNATESMLEIITENGVDLSFLPIQGNHRFAMRVFPTAAQREKWQQLARGASNANQITHQIRYRFIPLPDSG